MAKNKYGVDGEWSTIGLAFQRKVNGKYVTNAPKFVPACCLACKHYDEGEYAEMSNDLLSGPECKVNLRFPIRKGTCKRQSKA